MNQRLRRIRRVTELRDKQLREHIAELGKSLRREAAVKLQRDEAHQSLLQAEAERRTLGSRDTTLLTLMETEEWLATQSCRLDEATQELLKASRARAQRELEVQRARRKLRQLEKIEERLLARQKMELERAERKADDELAALRRRAVLRS
jgi:hypothetical protein